MGAGTERPEQTRRARPAREAGDKGKSLGIHCPRVTSPHGQRQQLIYLLGDPSTRFSLFFGCEVVSYRKRKVSNIVDWCQAFVIRYMGGTPDTWVTPDSDSSCSESAAADTSAGKERCMRWWGSFPSSGDVGGVRFAARTVAVWSYPRVRSSPHLPYTWPHS